MSPQHLTAAAILQNSSASVRIFDIQGMAHRSPLEGQLVTAVPGIVTAVRGNGFYLQDADGDDNPATSDAIFVFTGDAPTVQVGDAVEVDGVVGEFRPGGQASGNLTTTQIGGAGNPPAIATVLSSGNPLPPPLLIGLDGVLPPVGQIAGEAPSGTVEADDYTFDPTTNGIDFFESVEGMHVQVKGGVVVGPTNSFGETWILADNGEGATNRTPRGGVVIFPDDFNPERIQVQYDSLVTPGDAPVANVGDRLSSVIGVVDYSFGNFEILPTEAITVTPGDLERPVSALTTEGDRLTVASYNIENFHPGSPPEQIAGIAQHIALNLGGPDIIGLQEVQDNNGPVDDGTVDASESYKTLIAAIAAAGGPTYSFTDIAPENLQDGGQPGGNIRVGYLYNPERVSLVQRPGATATSATQGVNGRLSESPGRVQPDDPAFIDSRKPLAAEFVFNGQRVVVLNNHFSSKGGSDPLFGRFQPPLNNREDERTEQARINREFVEEILTQNPNARAIVLGDINEFQFLPPLLTLEGTIDGGEQVLFNLTNTLPEDERYSFIFQGNSQTLDHILVSDSLLQTAEYDVVHVNSEFADQASDHDPLLSQFDLPNAFADSGSLVIGTNGEDEIAAQGGQRILAGAGNDLVAPAPDSDGNNVIFGQQGDDELFARQNDVLLGGAGNDYLDASGGTGGNRLYGNAGNDTLFAGVNDFLFGGAGDDILYAGRGSNTLAGGAGGDQFWIAFNEVPELANTITDFARGSNVLGIRNVSSISGFEDLELIQSGSDTLIRALDTDVVLLKQVQASSLTSDQFVFA
ncbi:MAG: endonuclease/exonuclease/phosphatase family protein [Kaiparowitsia implicata GSE-PSE-MK54-09C]|jgi:endonuclease/exonuclease/phosphatase family metal-dependent hydrolase|nr:endonuclease/exonuclease/phosphatase family protein [Kaiparowitsia implicata GSE-PSE-MK54-09C]